MFGKIERKYEFRERLSRSHERNRRDFEAKKLDNEIEITSNWRIVCFADADERIVLAGKDLADYFETSLSLPVVFERLAEPEKADCAIILQTDPAMGKNRSFVISVEDKRIVITGNDAKGVISGCIYLEDQLNFREAPFIARGTEQREILVPLRIVHSGWGIDCFPDGHLNAIAHAGFTAVIVFVTGIDRTEVGPLDINDVINRSAKFGLDVILYGYLDSFKHPDEPDAREFFENAYTRLFEYYPDAAGIMLVGETAEFPSKDPHTTGKKCRESLHYGILDPRPSPGWYPCSDYPQWLQMVCDAVHKAKPDALIIFNTYNWHFACAEDRKKFLDAIPKEVMVQITFDIGLVKKREDVICQVLDYSISAGEPGHYFKSECEMAHAAGHRILCTANTTGASWDFGTIPYVPVPQQWLKRFRNLDYARRAWGVENFYDNHHYGWQPSVVTDLGKAFFWAPQCDPEAVIKKIAVRDYGAEAADTVVKVWELWSKGMDEDYVASNEEQYGPMRPGPSYPLIFHPNITRTMAQKEIDFPADEGAHFGGQIIKTFYQPFECSTQSPGFLRFPLELAALKRLYRTFTDGVEQLKALRSVVPARKLDKLEYLINLGSYIASCTLTTCHVKEWYMLNVKLLASDTREQALGYLDKLEAIALDEIKNAESAMPLVQKDSRLGWEPSMEYVTDVWHLEWKIRQVNTMLDGELRVFREMVKMQA